ncbi:MAG: SDR family oxidoreductase [Bacteroidota bacterium]
MDSSFSLSNKRALLTGGTGALGVAMAEALVAAGCRVAVMSRKQTHADETVKQLRSQASTRESLNKQDGNERAHHKIIGIQGDVLDRQSLIDARHQLEREWGGLDILVNAAGGNRAGATIGPSASFFDLSLDDFRGVSELNLDGTVLPCLIFGELLVKQGGSIVNISSMAADRTITRVLGYSAAKAGVDNFTRWLAVEMARKYEGKIRVNAIAPGFFIGEQNRRLLLNEDDSLTDRGQTIIRNTPMGRFGEAEELGTTLVWLCAPGSSFITGIVVPVDGGFSAWSGV